ncbi:hypothetical protein H4Q26_011524 [Puccinia striiformis f. sp. tritici PST-130]|nr:hypothetical protein H4Q26_011524 [Puccinia striiformis f. sp. tritici PST-130]
MMMYSSLRRACTTRPIQTISTRSQNYASLAGHFTAKPSRGSDLGWILGAGAVFVPTMGYLMTPRAAQHSSTSHAHPVEDKWSRSFAAEDLNSATLNVQSWPMMTGSFLRVKVDLMVQVIRVSDRSPNH